VKPGKCPAIPVIVYDARIYHMKPIELDMRAGGGSRVKVEDCIYDDETYKRCGAVE
jgi:hypothetical protein